MPQKQKQKTTNSNNNYRKIPHNLNKALAWHFQGLDLVLSKTSQNKIKTEGKRGIQENTQSQPQSAHLHKYTWVHTLILHVHISI